MTYFDFKSKPEVTTLAPGWIGPSFIEMLSEHNLSIHCVHFEKSTDFEFFCYPQSVWLSHLGYKEMMR